MYCALKGKPLSLQNASENQFSTLNAHFPQTTNSSAFVEKFLIRRELLAL